MRSTFALLGILTLAVGSAIAGHRQEQEPLAEQQFLNIKVFKGAKASDIVPAMEFISASLHVGCDYCHVKDRSSDEKEEKRTAREMILMQREINANHFNGRQQVTCATCHAGSTHPMNMPPLEGLRDRARRSNDVDPEKVLAAYETAVAPGNGPQPAGFKFEGTSVERGEKVNVDGSYSGAKFAFVAHRTAGDQKQGFNGSNVWFTTPRGTQVVPLEFSASFAKENAIYLSRETLPRLANPMGGTAKIDGKDMLVVSGPIEGESVRASLYFDKKTGLLARTVFYYPSILGTTAQINDYSDYKKVANHPFPMKVAVHSGDGDSTLEFRSVRFADKIDPTVFDPPK